MAREHSFGAVILYRHRDEYHWLFMEANLGMGVRRAAYKGRGDVKDESHGHQRHQFFLF